MLLKRLTTIASTVEAGNPKQKPENIISQATSERRESEAGQGFHIITGN